MDLIQLDMARHALGLPNARKCSYRNYYCASFGTFQDVRWGEMVDAGHAERHESRSKFVGYSLTESGARIALMPGETLDPEDFPEVATAAL